MGKSDEVADMSLEMCNYNGGQPYIYIYIYIAKNWREELEGRTGGKKWREEKWREKWRVDIMSRLETPTGTKHESALIIGVSVDIMSCGVYLVPAGVTNRD